MLRKFLIAAFLGMLSLSSTVAHAASITLAWDPSTGATGYRVFYGTQSGVYTTSVDVGNVTQAAVSTLTAGTYYYFVVEAYNAGGSLSSPSNEVSGRAIGTPTVTRNTDPLSQQSPARIAVALGQYAAGQGGWLQVRDDSTYSFNYETWLRLPGSASNDAGFPSRIAIGDVDGDGLDEIVVALNGGTVVVLDDDQHNYALLKWIEPSWAGFAATNGAVYPAVGDIDGDGKAEIVLGFGAGGHGWFQVLDDASTGYASLGWFQVSWSAYNAMNSAEVHPAVGDVNGDGVGEIILGLGSGSMGWVEVRNGKTQNFSSRNWLQVSWPAYNQLSGATFPAAGDLDADGRAEIVLGMGAGSQGWIEVRDDAAGNFASLKWLHTSWAAYEAANGETHPAVGNIDGDTKAEIVVGLGQGGNGWILIFDDPTANYNVLGWRQTGWTAFDASGGATWPAIGHLK